MPGVMITGGKGAIGSWVCRGLVEEGYRPVIYDLQEDNTLISDIIDKVDMVKGDILDLPSLINTIKKYRVDHIIHMAALMPPEAQENPARGFKVNGWGTVNILEAARITEVKRVVFTSSKGVYGEVKGDHAHPTYKPIDEDYPKNPWMVYSAGKVASENMGMEYHRSFGLDFIGLRFASTYGPGKLIRHGPVSIHCKVIENAMLGKPTKIPQGGDQKDDMVYNMDVAKGIILACFTKNVEHRVFHIGTGQGRTLRDLAEVLNNIYPKATIEIGPGLDYMGIGGAGYCILDISRARKELGYSPQYNLEEGVKHYIETMKRLKIEPKHIP